MRLLTTISLLLGLTAYATAADITAADVEAALEAKYGPFSGGAELNVNVETVAPYEGSKTVAEEGLPSGFKAIVWDKKTNRFAALVDGDNELSLRVAGTATQQMYVPFAKRRMVVGEVISASDIELRPIKFGSNTENMVMDITDLIGKEVSRPISQDRPIFSDLITAKNVIKRNEEVVLIFNKGNLQLSAKGKSLSNAAIGDTVKIIRSEASRPLEGIAVAEGVVKIIE